MSFYRNAFGNPVVAEMPGYSNTPLLLDTRYYNYTSIPELSPNVSPASYYATQPESTGIPEPSYWPENFIDQTPPTSGSNSPDEERPGALWPLSPPSPHDSSRKPTRSRMPRTRYEPYPSHHPSY
ncbi:hypothetical protein N7466_003331 [Penicillium verhagenii]|uniref:uncharacterized protein n=1 Tax=Penicillium verhagenii TaxID=1562060 RepID=UPI0025459C75|nr:uncharacterized protein N7466_003331 [Penicillium verhagenii]KAJ5936881.1 hypothetical protein N7466_003331 [Penicillium verhagenii]